MFSLEHIKIIKKNKKYNIKVKLTQIFIVIFFLTIWQILSSNNIINSFIFSSPKIIFKTIINLNNTNNLFEHIFVTLYEVFLSFSISIILSLLVSTLMWRFNFFAKVIDPFLTILNSLPKVALGPIIIIWAGASIKSIVITSLFISTIISIIDIYQGFISVDKNKIKLLKSMNASKFQIYKKLIIPSNISNFIKILKVNISMNLIGVIMGEFLVSKKGIGYLIVYGSQVFNLNLVISGIVVLCIISALLYYLITLLEKKIIKN